MLVSQHHSAPSLTGLESHYKPCVYKIKGHCIVDLLLSIDLLFYLTLVTVWNAAHVQHMF